MDELGIRTPGFEAEELELLRSSHH
jgi:hypothetical protein